MKHSSHKIWKKLVLNMLKVFVIPPSPLKFCQIELNRKKYVSPGQFEESTIYPDEKAIWDFYLMPLLDKMNSLNKIDK